MAEPAGGGPASARSRPRAPGTGAFVALIASFMAMAAMSTDINLPAVPSIQAALGTSLTAAQLTVTTFFVGIAFGQAFWGPLSDRVGRRPALLAGCAVYIAATLGCAASPGIGTLLAMRVLQGFGAGAGPVVGRAIVRDRFEGAAMARVMSLAMAAFITAPIIAPSVGALLLDVTGWRGIFVLLAAYGLVLTALATVSLGESLQRPDPDALRPGRLLTALTAIFREPASRRPAIAVVLVYATLNIYLADAAALFMDLHGLTPRQFGLVFAAVAAFSAAGNIANSRLVRTVPLTRLVRAGLIGGTGIAAATLALTALGVGGYLTLVLGFAGLFVTFGLVAANGMTMALAPHHRATGSAAAALGFTQAVIPALVASVVAALYDGTAVPTLLATLLLYAAALLVFRGHERGHAAVPLR